ncbi:hypothetical protein ACW9HL_30485, partial [Nocardia gipuzkoensis]
STRAELAFKLPTTPVISVIRWASCSPLPPPLSSLSSPPHPFPPRPDPPPPWTVLTRAELAILRI